MTASAHMFCSMNYPVSGHLISELIGTSTYQEYKGKISLDFHYFHVSSRSHNSEKRYVITRKDLEKQSRNYEIFSRNYEMRKGVTSAPASLDYLMSTCKGVN